MVTDVVVDIVLDFGDNGKLLREGRERRDDVRRREGRKNRERREEEQTSCSYKPKRAA
jgi:hypothetical protein